MNTHALRTVFFLAATICLAITAPLGAGETIAIRVLPRVAVAPATLSVDAVVEKNQANRAIQIQLNSDEYYRSSMMQLDGDQAPRTTSVRYEGVPGGTYEVRVSILGVDGKVRATNSMEVQIMSLVGR